MDPALAILLFLHIGAGASWLGGSVFANLFLLPFVLAQPIGRQRGLVTSLLRGPERMMIGSALTAAITGLVLGIAFGPLRSLDALFSRFGLLWGSAIVITVLVFATGARLTSPAMRRLIGDDSLWSESGSAAALLRAEPWRRLRIGFRIELVGILLVLGVMVLMGRS